MLKSLALSAAFLLALVVVGCASHSGDGQAQQVVEGFPKPAPLKSDPDIIRLQISAADGTLYFVSLDQPSWRDIHVEADRVTMDREGVLLKADELRWSLGETRVTLKGGRVTLDYKQQEGKTSQIVFAPSGNNVSVSENGKWGKTDTSMLVDIAADTGKIIFY